MKKAILVPIEQKKDAQIQEDIELGPKGRFYKMFDLIELSILFSPNHQLTQPLKPNTILLKRIA
jgi:hypothetical protein